MIKSASSSSLKIILGTGLGFMILGCTLFETADPENKKPIAQEKAIPDRPWEQTGGPEGGFITSIVPFQDGIFVGTATGLYYSTDNGQSWKLRLEGIEAEKIRFLASNDSFLFAGTNSGLFRSSDFGLNWSRADHGITHFSFTSITSRKNVLLAVSKYRVCSGRCEYEVFWGTETVVHMSKDNGQNWSIVKEPSPLMLSHNSGFAVVDGGFISAGSGGVFYSPDDGDTWESMGASLINEGINCFASDGETVYAGTLSGVYRSRDHGATWVGDNDWPLNKHVLGIALLNHSVFAITNHELFKSTDEGISWSKVECGMCSVMAQGYYSPELAVIKSNVYLGTSFGVLRSVDSGSSFELSGRGLIATDIAYINGFGKMVISGVRDNGVYISVDAGKTWSMNIGNMGISISGITSDGNSIFAGSEKGVFKFDTSSLSWIPKKNGLVDTEVVALGQRDSRLAAIVRPNWNGIYSQTNSIYVSNDLGESWKQAKTDQFIDVAKSIKILGDAIYVGLEGSGVSRSLDQGETWAPHKDGFGPLDLQIAGLATSSSTLYAFNQRGNAFFYSESEKSWIRIDSGGVSSNVSAIADGDSCVYFGTKNGEAFEYCDGKKTWGRIGRGVPGSAIGSAAKIGTRLYIGTQGKGVWKANLDSGS